MSSPAITPEYLMKLATGFQISKILSVATQLGIFTHISEGRTDRKDLSDALSIDERSLGALLNACVSVELLDKSGDTYSNTQISDTFLVKGKASYFGDMIIMQGTRLYDAWSKLEDTVTSGKPVADLFANMGADSQAAKLFTAAMHNNALGPARQLAEKVDLRTPPEITASHSFSG